MSKEVHYIDIRIDLWPWKNFLPSEIACKGTGLIIVDYDAMCRLQSFREIVGIPFTPNSAYRSKSHNQAVGGSSRSQHLLGRAFDIPIFGEMTREVIKKTAHDVGFTGIGDYNTFIHVDTGRKRYWDERK